MFGMRLFIFKLKCQKLFRFRNIFRIFLFFIIFVNTKNINYNMKLLNFVLIKPRHNWLGFPATFNDNINKNKKRKCNNAEPLLE